MPETDPENQPPKPAKKVNDTASEEALAARFAADRERFRLTEDEKDEVFRCVRRLFVIEGKMTQDECNEIERNIAEKKQKADQEKQSKEDCL